MLAEKINNGTPVEKDGKQLINRKTLDGFMRYACDEARKLAAKGASSACVEDKVVFGWAIHYFEEDSIEGTLYNADNTEYKPVRTPANKPSTNSTRNFTLTMTYNHYSRCLKNRDWQPFLQQTKM